MPISNRLFWMSCFPSMMMLSWMQSSIRQPPGAHCKRGSHQPRLPTPCKARLALLPRAELHPPCPGPWNLTVGPHLLAGSLQT